MKTSLAGDYAHSGVRFFEARAEGERHPAHETILGYVQKGSRRSIVDKHECDGMMATKKEPAPGPDRIPHSIYQVCGRVQVSILV